MKLSTRVVIGVMAMTAAISVGFVISGILIAERTEREYLSLTAHSKEAAALSTIRSSEEAFKRHARTVARERDAIAALVAGDLDALRDNMASTFNRLVAAGDVSHMAVYGADGVQAVGFPEKWTGDAPALVASTLAEGTTSIGMTRLPGGGVGYAYAVPLLKGREKVGAAIIALGVGAQLQTIADVIGGDAALVLKGAESTRTENAPSFAQATAGLAGPDNFGLIHEGDRTFVAVRAQLLDGAAVGEADLLLFSDFTRQNAAITTRTLTYLGAIIFITASLVGGFLFWLRREIGPLSTMTGSLAALSRGEPVADISVTSRADEISALGDALAVFVDQSIRQQELLEDQRIKAEEAQVQAEMAAALQAALGDVMSLAASGNFTSRMRIDPADPASVEIGAHVNRMLDATEHAMERVDGVLRRLADADLTQEMSGRFNGCFADLQTSVNATLARLRTLIGDAQQATATVSTVSERIKQDAVSLAARVEGQSATLEQTAATTEEIAGGVRSSAASLEQAGDLAKQVRDTTGEGSARVEEAIAAVLRIQSESDGIQEIVSVIESIAFQTNLLALNAAVEAARAGEQGKGFAVVASEVRTLAQRASDAAKDIKTKVETSGASVGDGVKFAEVAGESLKEIETNVATLVGRIQQCAQTGRDQAGSIAEMNRAITHLDQIGQESSSVSDRNSLSAQSLSEEVATLSALIGAFKMADAPEGLRAAS